MFDIIIPIIKERLKDKSTIKWIEDAMDASMHVKKRKKKNGSSKTKRNQIKITTRMGSK